MNGTASYEGRVEVCYDGVWGSVYDDGWGNYDAAVVCRQMGFQGESMHHYYVTFNVSIVLTLCKDATALRGSYFGEGRGPHHLGGVSCNGGEKTLLECSYSRSIIRNYQSTPGHDAGVRCDGDL